MTLKQLGRELAKLSPEALEQLRTALPATLMVPDTKLTVYAQRQTEIAQLRVSEALAYHVA